MIPREEKASINLLSRQLAVVCMLSMPGQTVLRQAQDPIARSQSDSCFF